MINGDQDYHRRRAEQCRKLAAAAADPDVRRRHEELAELHASAAAKSHTVGNEAAGLSPA
jgi:hypothetical protein